MPGTFTAPVKADESKPTIRTVTIVNITEQRWVLHRTYRAYVIDAADPNLGYSLAKIPDQTAVIDLGDKRKSEFVITADDIAHDIVRELNSDIHTQHGAKSFTGVFVAEGAVPTARELEMAKERLTEFDIVLVNLADAEWDRAHNPILIPDDARRAARRQGFQKEWLYRQQQMAECPACGERIKPGVAVCKSCGAILDREKAMKFGIIASPAEPEQLPEVAAANAATYETTQNKKARAGKN